MTTTTHSARITASLLAAKAERDAPTLTLSQMASRIAQITRSHTEALEYDSGFDAGEFSGPACYRAITRDVEQALRDGGWTADRYDDALIARTSERFVHFSGLSAADVFQDDDRPSNLLGGYGDEPVSE